jgi:hypothetical protein
MEQIKPQVREIGEEIKNYYRTKRDKNTDEGEPGYLIITNNNLLFYKERVDYKKEYKLKYNFNLNNLLDIKIGGNLNKFIEINGIRFYLGKIENFINDLREYTEINHLSDS